MDAYYKLHQAERQAYQRIYYNRNKAECIRRKKEWQEKNKEHIKQYQHEYYLKRRQKNAE